MIKNPLLQLAFTISLCLIIGFSVMLAFSFFNRQMYYDTFISIVVIWGAIDTIKKMESKELEKTTERIEIVMLKLQPILTVVMFLICILKHFDFL